MWKDIPWYEWLYQASDWWFIRSIRRSKVLHGRYHRQWYILVNLYKDKRLRTWKVHRLIMITYIENVNQLPQVNHKNWIKDDNTLSNLEWCDAKHNTNHAVKNWFCMNNIFRTKNPSTWKKWKDSPSSVSVIQYSLQGEYIARWYSMADVYRTLWIHVSSIWACCKKKIQSAWWFIWKYDNQSWQ